tara:strand:+ start:26673 stop:27914 length:1242 start_codon:yes stop_codon:yes gene_type:complete
MSFNYRDQFRPQWKRDLQPLIAQFRTLPFEVQKQLLIKSINIGSQGDEVIIDTKKNSQSITSPKSTRIISLEDLIEASNIDTNIWEVERYIVNKWEVGSQIDGRVVVEPLFQVKAWLKKNKDIFKLEALRIEMLEEIKSYSPKVDKIKYPKFNKGQLLEINIFDLHFGKLCWGKETGDNYDTKIARERFLEAIRSIISRVKGYNIKKIVFPIGNDFFNSDNKSNTTSNNTPQDEDLRWQKTYKTGRELLIEGIDLLQVIAPVDVIVVQGNHDFERSFYVGDAMECWYNNNPNIVVNNGANPRKHYKFGDCLITYTHGNNEKIADLPLLVASEVPGLWASTKYREVHVGHLHHKKEIKFMSTQEHKGMVVRFMRSLSGTDAWHNLKGYTGGVQGCEAFIWDEKEGLICQFSHNL